jgi:hypothetical protein
MVLDSEHQSVTAGLILAGGNDASVVRIKDTLNLEYILVSKKLLDEVIEHPDLELVARRIPLFSAPEKDLNPFPDP